MSSPIVYIEVDDQPTPLAAGIVPGATEGLLGNLFKRTQTVGMRELTDEACEQLRAGVERVTARLKNLVQDYDELEVSFGVELSIEGGVVIKAGGKGTIGVKLVWKKPTAPSSPPPAPPLAKAS
jgi:hypothetical protein